MSEACIPFGNLPEDLTPLIVWYTISNLGGVPSSTKFNAKFNLKLGGNSVKSSSIKAPSCGVSATPDRVISLPSTLKRPCCNSENAVKLTAIATGQSPRSDLISATLKDSRKPNPIFCWMSAADIPYGNFPDTVLDFPLITASS